MSAKLKFSEMLLRDSADYVCTVWDKEWSDFDKGLFRVFVTGM